MDLGHPLGHAGHPSAPSLVTRVIPPGDFRHQEELAASSTASLRPWEINGFHGRLRWASAMQ